MNERRIVKYNIEVFTEDRHPVSKLEGLMLCPRGCEGGNYSIGMKSSETGMQTLRLLLQGIPVKGVPDVEGA